MVSEIQIENIQFNRNEQKLKMEKGKKMKRKRKEKKVKKACLRLEYIVMVMLDVVTSSIYVCLVNIIFNIYVQGCQLSLRSSFSFCQFE